VHRAAYADPAVFALEMERIFRRAWLYVGHESEIPRAGDYALAPLAGDEVLLVRQEDGSVAALHNRCAHRGARIATCPGKAARALRCPYHSWTYRLDGSLLGVPLPEGYDELPAGLARVPRLESYRGFLFATHDATAPALREYLGELASAFDNMVDRAPEGTLTRFGGRLQLEYRGNW
jgi:phenylpropionate dioxygenase-like ring-hydroxylating dioxygenase large terminal subunit